MPFPNIPATEGERLEIIVRMRIPATLVKLLGFSLPFEEPPLLIEEPSLVSEARKLFSAGIDNLQLCDEGVGGTYILKTADGYSFSVFKPTDEEPGAQNNPKKLVQNPILPPGGGSAREVAAYLLDKDHFAGVPETYFISDVRHGSLSTSDVKSGSLQRFIPNEGESSSFGSSLWSVEDVHRVGTLDIRIFNLDRNGENLLVQNTKDGRKLIPIDHSYCLPPITSLNNAYFEWQFWPQAKKPFSQQTIDYVSFLNIESDAAILRSIGIAEESVQTMMVSTVLLQEAVTGGWTLYEIASFIARDFSLSVPSRLEELLATCRTVSENSGRPFMEVYHESVRELVAAKKN